ncbi:MAG: DNA polymerase III subunit delta' [Sphingomonadales bacterium BRH_c42]|nr:MAG: DNA polymerase III subunit delta' [Sphingomonadales bacterium BRH_c42]
MEWPNHAEPRREWHEAMGGARMHHAWLLAGKAGLGKREFALAAARALVAEDGIQQPAVDHPDILVLTHLPKDEKEEAKRQEGKAYEIKRGISVAQIRAMQQRLFTRPTLGSRRAVIIDPADDLEKSASNALLKSLEEPPQGTYFLLVAHRPQRLLPTIRSRCRMLRFAELSDNQIAQMLRQYAPDADLRASEAAISAAGGSFGAAMGFIEQNLAPVAALMREIAEQGDPAFKLRGQLVAAIGARPDRARIQAALDLARAIAAQQAERCSPDRSPQLIDAHAALVELAGQASTYNFDVGLLVMEIGSLLARAAAASERADA